jgi:hypothetical protein
MAKTTILQSYPQCSFLNRNILPNNPKKTGMNVLFVGNFVPWLGEKAKKSLFHE